MFEERQRDGAFVSVGDFTGDGIADMVFGGGPSGGPRVRVVDSTQALGGFLDLDKNLGLVVSNFFAGDPNTRGGVRVAARDVDVDGLADLVTGGGSNLRSDVRVYTGANLKAANAAGKSPAPDQQFDPFSSVLAAGIFVG